MWAAVAVFDAGGADHLPHEHGVFAGAVLFIYEYRLVCEIHYGVKMIGIFIESRFFRVTSTLPRAQAFGGKGIACAFVRGWFRRGRWGRCGFRRGRGSGAGHGSWAGRGYRRCCFGYERHVYRRVRRRGLRAECAPCTKGRRKAGGREKAGEGTFHILNKAPPLNCFTNLFYHALHAIHNENQDLR